MGQVQNQQRLGDRLHPGADQAERPPGDVPAEVRCSQRREQPLLLRIRPPCIAPVLRHGIGQVARSWWLALSAGLCGWPMRANGAERESR
jgi:hypothetical protein